MERYSCVMESNLCFESFFVNFYIVTIHSLTQVYNFKKKINYSF